MGLGQVYKCYFKVKLVCPNWEKAIHANKNKNDAWTKSQETNTHMIQHNPNFKKHHHYFLKLYSIDDGED
jgi:hypothetical protein